MFGNTIDKKLEITDNNGNTIKDLTTSIFISAATILSRYNTVRLNETYQMRADKVSYAEYGNIDDTEFILKYSGISNPFSLDKDDILMIPDEQDAKAQMADLNVTNDNVNAEEQARNYFKFTNKDFKQDKTSYDALANKEIKSGVLDPTEANDYIVPYISDDGTAAITFRNGRMFFGEDNGTSLDTNIQAVIDATATTLSDQCAMNGLTLAQFVKASTSNSQNK